MSMSQSRPDSPSGPKADATRQAIVDTADRLFRTLGYQKTTVADIARAMRMSPANVYRFFPSKAAINEAIADRILTGLAEHVWSIARGPGTASARIRSLFKTLQEETIRLFFNEKQLHDMVAAAMAENWAAIEAHIRQIDSAFRHVIMDGQVAGEFARSDPDETARLVHWVTVPFCHPMLVQQKCADEDLPALAEALATFTLRALRPD